VPVLQQQLAYVSNTASSFSSFLKLTVDIAFRNFKVHSIRSPFAAGPIPYRMLATQGYSCKEKSQHIGTHLGVSSCVIEETLDLTFRNLERHMWKRAHMNSLLKSIETLEQFFSLRQTFQELRNTFFWGCRKECWERVRWRTLWCVHVLAAGHQVRHGCGHGLDVYSSKLEGISDCGT
jgi:hypothetical protein